MTDAQYNRCYLRERYVAFASTDKASAMRFLRDNEQRFRRANFDKRAMEEMHRAILWTGYERLTSDDLRFLDSLFGPHVESRPTAENTQHTSHPYDSYRPPQTALEWMHEMKFSTFVRFRKWMNCQEGRNAMNKLDEYGKECLCDAIEYQLQMKYVLPFQESEGYTDEDMVWINNI